MCLNLILTKSYSDIQECRICQRGTDIEVESIQESGKEYNQPYMRSIVIEQIALLSIVVLGLFNSCSSMSGTYSTVQGNELSYEAGTYTFNEDGGFRYDYYTDVGPPLRSRYGGAYTKQGKELILYTQHISDPAQDGGRQHEEFGSDDIVIDFKSLVDDKLLAYDAHSSSPVSLIKGSEEILVALVKTDDVNVFENYLISQKNSLVRLNGNQIKGLKMIQLRLGIRLILDIHDPTESYYHISYANGLLFANGKNEQQRIVKSRIGGIKIDGKNYFAK